MSVNDADIEPVDDTVEVTTDVYDGVIVLVPVFVGDAVAETDEV